MPDTLNCKKPHMTESKLLLNTTERGENCPDKRLVLCTHQRLYEAGHPLVVIEKKSGSQQRLLSLTEKSYPPRSKRTPEYLLYFLIGRGK